MHLMLLGDFWLLHTLSQVKQLGVTVSEFFFSLFLCGSAYRFKMGEKL